MALTTTQFRDFVRQRIPDAYLVKLEEIWDAYRDCMAVALIKARVGSVARGLEPDAEIRLQGALEFMRILTGAKSPVAKPDDVNPNVDINIPQKTRGKRLTKQA
jgi:hypothetical protein